jgi:Prolipoprotein diacylglyceryl transferase
MLLDGCARLHVDARGRWSSYQILGGIGYVVALVLTMILATLAGLGIAARLVVSVVPPLAFLLGVKLSDRVFGYERIVFYEQAILALAAAAVMAALGGAPVGACLDLVSLGLGTFLVFGRIGCLMVGCCYGRPARRGIRYGEAHAHAGFPARLVGQPLVPLQLLDSALSLGLVVAGVVVALDYHAPGDVTVLYFGGYGVGRFALELWRGDPARPYFLGVSEAQWTALVLGVALAIARPGWLAIVASAALLGVGVIVLVVARRRLLLPHFWLTSPWHVEEVSRAFHRPASPDVAVTTLGLRLSMHELPGQRRDVVVSLPASPLSERAVKSLIWQMGLAGRPGVEVRPGATAGLVHILTRED